MKKQEQARQRSKSTTETVVQTSNIVSCIFTRELIELKVFSEFNRPRIAFPSIH
jgi:hypothetical protein